MAELLKDMYNYESIHRLALNVQSAYQPFPIDDFMRTTMDETWDELELKERVRQIAKNLGRYLPADYDQAIGILDQVAAGYPTEGGDFFLIFFPDFVELYGQDEENWDLSMAALERYTPYSSSEFAVRPFIINHEERMMSQMLAWSKHENEHVRRLASEGCRPQLPWGQALVSFKKDPSPVLVILEQLKDDPSPYVRKSVANNLNDISKTHPDLVTELAKNWYGKSERTDWILKHGCRTLLKKGNRDVLAIFGFCDGSSIDLEGFSLSNTAISIGREITFSFTVAVEKPTKVRLEYGIDYVKARGERNRKIFQISELSLKANQRKNYEKSHSFADLSTRKHYPGAHSIALIVNGVERGKLDFELEV